MSENILQNHPHTNRWFAHPHPQVYVVHLLWDEISFDIKYGVIKRAKLAGVEAQATNKYKPAKNYRFTESDEDWMLRMVERAVGNAKAKLRSACDSACRCANDQLKVTSKDYDLIFRFDGDVQWLGSPADLMNYIHEYIVDYCISDFLEMDGMIQQAARMTERANDSLQKAYEEINSVIIETPKFIL